MKRCLLLFLMVWIPGWVTVHVQAQSNFPPIQNSHVVDAAGILSAQTVTSLDHLIQSEEDTSGNQVMVLTIPDLEGRDIESYANDAYNHYNLGQKNTDNGVLLVISNGDRKIRIEVGYGLEGVLPDALCGRIINDEIKPYFKQGDFDAGVTNGVNAILQAIHGVYTADDNGDGKLPWWVPLVLILGFMAVIIIMGIFKGRGGGGGGFGGGRYYGGGYYGGGWSSGGGGWSGGGGGGWSGGGGGFSGGGGASGGW